MVDISNDSKCSESQEFANQYKEKEKKNRKINNRNATSLRVAEIGLYYLWKHFLLSYLETLPLFCPFRIQVTVECRLLSSASRGCWGFAVIRSEPKRWMWAIIVNGSDGFIPLSFCMAGREKTNPNGKKEISSLLWCFDDNPSVEEHSYIMQIRLYCSEPWKSFEMKRCLQSCMVLLGFKWASSAPLNSADNLWCGWTWCPGEKLV